MLLAAEVVIEHALVGLGPARDLVDACAEQPSTRELFGCRHQDAAACTFRISFDFWLIHGGVLLCEPRDPDPDRHPHRLGAGCPGTSAPHAAALLLSPCKKAVRLCAQTASSAMREIGDNQGLANLSGRARRGREPFGAAAPVVTVTDSKTLADRIEDLLPQTQCTKCGYNGCRPYAEAIAAGDANYNQCPPGGAEGIARLARLLGKPVIPLNPVNGAEHPRAVAFIDESLCIGCTLCMQACPVDAIIGAPKQMHTIVESLCTGCDLCVPPCPVDCIAMVPVTDGSAPAGRVVARNRRRRAASATTAGSRASVAKREPPRRAAARAAAAPAPARPRLRAAAEQPAHGRGTSRRRRREKAARSSPPALERARKKKEELSGQGAGPKNTEGVSAAVQAQIDAAEARRKRLAEQQAQRDAEAAGDTRDDPNHDDRNGPSAPPDKNRP
ncbi:electron transport complex subunit RsxB [Burkholderia sp. USMB20]|uniref:electron transport complex subunit RsxB n=1 Tax=Burkholderia sp. USMB20 TaxID=1571773 RepID=UPI003FA4AE5A